MTQLEGVFLLIGLCGGTLLSGYWLAALTAPDTTAAERLAVALLAGLGSLLLLVSVVNIFLPLSLPWSLLCLPPLLLTAARGACRRQLWADTRDFCRDRDTRLAGLLIGAFLLLLLSGLLTDGQTLFYDASPNHDSYFWVTGADHLRRHTYLVEALATPTHPVFASTNALIGLKPHWGRMGAEGLLALSSSLVGASPLKIYLYGTTPLFLVWLAGIYLTAKTFFQTQLSRPALVGLALFQPLFIFYYANGNLPNLLGALCGAGAVIGTERALRAPARPAGPFLAWCSLIVLSLHGLACSYPEMIPFIGLSCGLLWLRPWITRPLGEAWRPALLVAGAAVLGFALNPLTTLRAWHGFFSVLHLAKSGASYQSVLEPLTWGEYLPGLLTLAIPAAELLGDWLGATISLLLLAGLGTAVWQARDRFGVLAILAGSACMLAYTAVTGFAYGWQKAVQFGGVFIATIAPVMMLDTLARTGRATPAGRRLALAAPAALMLFFAYATVSGWREVRHWAGQKRISADWFNLRNLSRERLQDAPVLVEQAAFRMPFFHGMWSAYFLQGSDVYYGFRGEAPGGYQAFLARNERQRPIPTPAAYVVGSAWADSFDANSPRILSGREYTLLQKCNRVFALAGVYPLNGPPLFASDRITLDILPHAASNLLVDLEPRREPAVPAGRWRISRRAPGHADFSAEVSGAPPWRLTIPLVAGQRNEVAVTYEHAAAPLDPWAFPLRGLRIEDAP